jgi:hypothetical protein
MYRVTAQAGDVANTSIVPVSATRTPGISQQMKPGAEYNDHEHATQEEGICNSGESRRRSTIALVNRGASPVTGEGDVSPAIVIISLVVGSRGGALLNYKTAACSGVDLTAEPTIL